MTAAGSGEGWSQGLARLFPVDEPRSPLELLSAETFTTGVLNLHYAPVKG